MPAKTSKDLTIVFGEFTLGFPGLTILLPLHSLDAVEILISMLVCLRVSVNNWALSYLVYL